ncbi:MAG: HAD-IIA family hydrolase [candidate division NC10 bacterium]|nr:HAD-IIA family hydrolase [candidate division NC10 bacterium]MBI4841679.1 HAD-IIA family hydrolase [candidate division NC10 bacterium]
MDLRSLRAFIFDLDGCVYTGNTLVPGVQAFLQELREKDRRILFLTNNSREAGEELQAKLARLGILATREEVLSAVEIVGPLIRDRYGPSPILVIGGETLRRLLAEAGHSLVPLEAYREARVVVLGHDFDFDYRKLTAAARAVAGGAAFLAVNVDPRLPVEDGEFYPGCGTLAEAVAAAAGVKPEVVGKPMPHIFRAALARLGGVPADEAAMVGDSLASDVRGAQALGLKTIWLAPPGAAAGEVQPDLIIHHFAELQGRL